MKLKKTLIALSAAALVAGSANAVTAPLLTFADSKAMSYSVYIGYNHRYLDVTQTGPATAINVEEHHSTKVGEENSVNLKDKSTTKPTAADEDEKPAAESEKPAAESEKPAAEGEKPSVEEKAAEKPAAKTEAKDAEAASEEYPTLPYQGRLYTLGFSAHYNVVDNNDFKFALGGDFALSTGNYTARTKDEAGKYSQAAHINVELGVSALATLKTDSCRPFVKAGVAYEYGRLFAYHGVNVITEVGVEALNGLKFSVGYSYSYGKAQQFDVAKDFEAPKTIKGSGFLVNVGFTF